MSKCRTTKPTCFLGHFRHARSSPVFAVSLAAKRQSFLFALSQDSWTSDREGVREIKWMEKVRKNLRCCPGFRFFRPKSRPRRCRRKIYLWGMHCLAMFPLNKMAGKFTCLCRLQRDCHNRKVSGFSVALLSVSRKRLRGRGTSNFTLPGWFYMVYSVPPTKFLVVPHVWANFRRVILKISCSCSTKTASHWPDMQVAFRAQ